MISFDEAAGLLARLAKPLATEELELGQAAGRLLSAPVRARIDSPRADVSSMDGYAVREAEAGRGASLPIAGKSYPGLPVGGALEPGSCVRVFTGAAVPAGTDRVVVQEEVDERAGRATFRIAPSGPRFIRSQGSDFRTGDLLLTAGQRLTPGSLMAIAGGDVGTVEVSRRPRIGLLVTGDELVPAGAASKQPAAIPDSVAPAIAAMVADWGGTVCRSERLGDDLAASSAVARALLADCDLLVITGGASVGEKDHAKAILAAIEGELVFSKVAMKPGKPVWAGQAQGRSVLGLPGNPTSALVTARLFLVPLLCAMGGRAFAEGLRFRTLPLAQAVPGVGNRETFLRGTDRGDRVDLAAHQDLNGQRTPAIADLLVRVKPGSCTLDAGTLVPVLAL